MNASMVVLPVNGSPAGAISIGFSAADISNQAVAGAASNNYTLGVQAGPFGTPSISFSIAFQSTDLYSFMFQCPANATAYASQQGPSVPGGKLLLDLYLQWDNVQGAGVICGQWTAVAAPTNVKITA